MNGKVDRVPLSRYLSKKGRGEGLFSEDSGSRESYSRIGEIWSYRVQATHGGRRLKIQSRRVTEEGMMDKIRRTRREVLEEKQKMLLPQRWERRGVGKSPPESNLHSSVSPSPRSSIILVTKPRKKIFSLRNFLAVQTLKCRRGLKGSRINSGDTALKSLINLHLFHWI